MNVSGLPKFDILSMKHHPMITVMGYRGTGKTTMVKDIMFHMRNKLTFRYGQIISTKPLEEYKNYVPETNLHPNYNVEIITAELKEMMKIKEKEKEKKEKKEKKISAFLILDDCMYDCKWSRDKIIRLTLMNGRFWNIMTIMAYAHPTAFPPNVDDPDYLFVFNNPSINYRKRTYDKRGILTVSFDVFCQMLDNLDRYECLVIERGNTFFWYKAELHPSFKMNIYDEEKKEEKKEEREVKEVRDYNRALMRHALWKCFDFSFFFFLTLFLLSVL
jgi:HrpA-like RNA helicase